MPSTLRLEPVTDENVEDACRLTIRPEQEPFVEPVSWSLALAYVHPDIAWPRLVVDGDQPVGFVMAFLDVDFEDGAPPRSGIWRLNVAADRQGRGYGRFAVHAVCEEVRRRGGDRASVTWAQGEHGPEGFYLRLGFRLTGGRSGDQVVAELPLTRGQVPPARGPRADPYDRVSDRR